MIVRAVFIAFLLVLGSVPIGPAVAVAAQVDEQRSAVLRHLDTQDAEPPAVRAREPLLHAGTQDRLLPQVAPPAPGDDPQAVHPADPAGVDPLGEAPQGVLRPETVQIDRLGIIGFSRFLPVGRVSRRTLSIVGASHAGILMVLEPTLRPQRSKLSLVTTRGVPRSPRHHQH